MKKIYSIITILVVLFFVSACQSNDEFGQTGYLRLNVETNAYVHPQTKVSDDYNPKQIAIQIVDASGKVVKEWDDHTSIGNSPVSLKQGTYTIKASSNGFDGSESGFELPYYTGSKEITIEAGKEETAEIICTLANVKVTVNFDQSFIDAFNSAKATVGSQLSGVNSLDFIMGTTSKSGYFPVGDLTSTISVVNKTGISHSQSNNISGVKARDHYILNYKVAEQGNGSVSVVVDGSETIYTFEFSVSTEVKTNLEAKKANAWGQFALIEGEILSTKEELDPTKISFEYKVATASDWNTASATKAETTYTGELTGLTANTQYVYRMVYRDPGKGSEFISNETTFTTGAEPTLVNGNMDDWYKNGKVWYAASENYYNANGTFWDSGNKGTSTMSKNPTQGNSTTVHTAGGNSAELKSQYVGVTGTLGKFAAGNLYTGTFGELLGMSGAKLNFGQPFTARPAQLHGWYHYTPGTIDYKGDNTPASAGIEKGKTTDICSIYIALSTKAYEIDNTNPSTFIDFDNDENIIAYGELPASDCVSTSGNWKEFKIDMKYHSLTKQPTYIIIVCSASKYGDYFTGSTNSVMYLDDLELIYPKTSNDITVKK